MPWLTPLAAAALILGLTSPRRQLSAGIAIGAQFVGASPLIEPLRSVKDPAEQDALRALLQPGEISLTGEHCDTPGRIEWWPVLLRGALDAERLAATGIQGYRARSGNLLFAINWSQGRAYYWQAVAK